MEGIGDEQILRSLSEGMAEGDPLKVSVEKETTVTEKYIITTTTTHHEPLPVSLPIMSTGEIPGYQQGVGMGDVEEDELARSLEDELSSDTFKQTRAVAEEAARKAEETLEGAAPVGEEYAPMGTKGLVQQAMEQTGQAAGSVAASAGQQARDTANWAQGAMSNVQAALGEATDVLTGGVGMSGKGERSEIAESMGRAARPLGTAAELSMQGADMGRNAMGRVGETVTAGQGKVQEGLDRAQDTVMEVAERSKAAAAPGLTLQERLGRIQEAVTGGIGLDSGKPSTQSALRDTLARIQELVTGGVGESGTGSGAPVLGATASNLADRALGTVGVSPDRTAEWAADKMDTVEDTAEGLIEGTEQAVRGAMSRAQGMAKQAVRGMIGEEATAPGMSLPERLGAVQNHMTGGIGLETPSRTQASGPDLRERLGHIQNVLTGGIGLESGTPTNEWGLRDVLGRIQNIVTGGVEQSGVGSSEAPVLGATAASMADKALGTVGVSPDRTAEWVSDKVGQVGDTVEGLVEGTEQAVRNAVERAQETAKGTATGVLGEEATAPGLSLSERLGAVQNLMTGGPGLESPLNTASSFAPGLRERLGRIQELVTGGIGIESTKPSSEDTLRDILGEVQNLLTGDVTQSGGGSSGAPVLGATAASMADRALGTVGVSPDRTAEWMSDKVGKVGDTAEGVVEGTEQAVRGAVELAQETGRDIVDSATETAKDIVKGVLGEEATAPGLGVRERLGALQNLVTGGVGIERSKPESAEQLRDVLKRIQGLAGEAMTDLSRATEKLSREGEQAGVGRVPLERIQPTTYAHKLGEARALKDADTAAYDVQELEARVEKSTDKMASAVERVGERIEQVADELANKSSIVDVPTQYTIPSQTVTTQLPTQVSPSSLPEATTVADRSKVI